MTENVMERDQVVNSEEIVSMKEWFITTLIMCVPLVNFVMPFVWAFGGGSKKSKANYFKAQLLFAVIVILLWIFVGASLLAAFSY